MTENELQAVRTGAFLAAMALAVLLQRLAPHGRLRGSWSVNGALWLVNAVLVGVVCGGCAFTTARWAAAEGIGALNVVGAGLWLAAPVSVLALDFVSYGWHWANHRVALLWRFHQVHHSDPTFTVSTGLRFHPGELLLSLPVRLAAVVLLGAPAEAVLAFEIVFALTNLIEHGDIDLPRGVERRLDRIVITPALHRWHHTRTAPERHSNFGTIFALWDRLLGTYAASDSGRVVDTGLPGLDRVPLAAALGLPVRDLRLRD